MIVFKWLSLKVSCKKCSELARFCIFRSQRLTIESKVQNFSANLSTTVHVQNISYKNLVLKTKEQSKLNFSPKDAYFFNLDLFFSVMFSTLSLFFHFFLCLHSTWHGFMIVIYAILNLKKTEMTQNSGSFWIPFETLLNPWGKIGFVFQPF